MHEKTATWVIYMMTIRKQDGMKAVCEQKPEWRRYWLRPDTINYPGGFMSEAKQSY